MPYELEEWVRRLRSLQNRDGGFPYFPDRLSSLEPTCLGILALEYYADREGSSNVSRAREFLASRQSDEGHWLLVPENSVPVWETPLILLALAGDPSYSRHCRKGIDVYLDIIADAANPKDVTLNPQFRGWNWYPPTPGWVEPTSLGLLAVQRLGGVADAKRVAGRLDDGRSFLLDRMSPEGGWNYGNSYVLGSPISPFLAPTALALLALRSLVWNEPRVDRGLQYLERNLAFSPSGLTLSWCILALAAFERSADRPITLLFDVWRRSRFLENLAVLSLAVMAATTQSQGPNHPFHTGTYHARP